MTAPTEDLIADLEALLAGEPVFVVGHPVSRAITALRALQQEVERLRGPLPPLPGSSARQINETITVTAHGDETYAELRKAVADALPDSHRCCGGLNRIRKGEPVLGDPGRLHTEDRQASVAFVAHHPRSALTGSAQG